MRERTQVCLLIARAQKLNEMLGECQTPTVLDTFFAEERFELLFEKGKQWYCFLLGSLVLCGLNTKLLG